MPIRKKKRFGSLKAGEFFKWKRKLYIKSDWSDGAIQVSNGRDISFEYGDLIIPVKVKINIIK